MFWRKRPDGTYVTEAAEVDLVDIIRQCGRHLLEVGEQAHCSWVGLHMGRGYCVSYVGSVN